MLDLSSVDVDELCSALEDHSPGVSWWIDPESGEIRVEPDDGETDDALDAAGVVFIEPLRSADGYRDMADFGAGIGDRRARERLSRAIEGRGAFRRFKDELVDFSDLRQVWFDFHNARMARRAIEWLVDHHLISDEAAARASGEYLDPELPGAGVDPHQLAIDVAADLRSLYGPRLVEVVLFGSTARGDDDADSDLDLLVVLAEVSSPWDELRRMDDVLWRHTERSGVTVSAFPVGRTAYERGDSPVLVRVRREAVPVG
ncbi:MAG: hypothetical protein NVS3B12_29980 [Acidimicrobiales bacterium]